MSLARTLCLLLIAAVGACSGSLPNSALPRHLAARFVGALTAATPLASVIRNRNLRPPDVESTTPLLEQLYDALARSDPDGAYAGITYDLTHGNKLMSDWLVQTPHRWGRAAADLPFYPLDCLNCERDVLLPLCSTDADCNGGICSAIWPAAGSALGTKRNVCFGHSDAVLPRIYELIGRARQRVDVTLLQPAPDARFLAAIRAAIERLARSQRPVALRFLIGQYPPGSVDTTAFLKALTAGLDAIPEGQLTVSVAAMRSCVVLEDCDSFSWNHSKIITVDGREVLAGGHNLWSTDYLVDKPVHDLSMRISGPAAASAAHFTDALWRYVCANDKPKDSISVATYVRGQSAPSSACTPLAGLPPAPQASGGIPILAVGRLGAGVTKDFANQSELARDLMLGAARNNILIVQQDLGFNMGRGDTLFPESTIDRLVDFLRREEGEINIVLSNEGAVGNSGSAYSNDIPLERVARTLRDALQRRFERNDPLMRYEVRRGPDPVNAILCERITLAPFRFGPDAKWPGGRPIANHSKLWMVDDRAFYIGSDNMYPVNLQEYGYIVDDPAAARELIDSYWKPLRQWSRLAAVSGPGVKDCIFRRVRQ